MMIVFDNWINDLCYWFWIVDYCAMCLMIDINDDYWWIMRWIIDMLICDFIYILKHSIVGIVNMYDWC